MSQFDLVPTTLEEAYDVSLVRIYFSDRAMPARGRAHHTQAFPREASP